MRKGVCMPKGVFNKSILKIFMVLLIVIAVMFFSNYYVYKSSMDAMFEQAETNNRLVVRGVIQSFEESFKEINDIIYTVGTLPYRVYDSDWPDNINMNSAYLLIKNVNQLISQDYIHDFIIFSRNSDLALTISGTESFQRVFSKKYKSDKFAPEYWRNYAVTSHPMKIIPVSYYHDEWSSVGVMGRNLLAIVASNQISNSVENIVVFVDVAKLYEKVNKQSMMQGSSLVILDKDKNVIISTDGDYELEGQESAFFNSDNDVTFQEGKYNYHIVQSEYNSFKYINKVPYRYEGAISTIQINKRILLLTTFAGILISLLISLYIYRPIRRILALVGIKDGENNQNHYQHIYESIEKMQLENRMITSRMDNVKEEVMRSVFFKMIDDITFYKDMKTQIDTYFQVIFSSRQFLMVAFDLGNTKNILDDLDEDHSIIMPEKMINEIQKSLENIGNVSVVVFYLENMQLVALVGVNDPIKRDKLLKEIDAVKDKLQSTVLTNYHVIVAVSKFYTEAQSCKEAFDDIQMCFSYRSVSSTKTLIDLEKNEYTYDIYMPLDLDEKLSNYILSGNSEESVSLIRQVIETNVKNNVSYIKFQSIINSIFNNIINILIHLNADREKILATEIKFRRTVVPNYIHYEKITAFFTELIEQTMDKVRAESPGKLNKEFVIQYIQLHYAENLYLDKMAEIFDTTPKYFSNFFKKAFSINFIEYLNKVRISHAKEMLKGSDFPVNEIGERIGYLNPSTFASTFKKYCGITPSEFRKGYKT